MRPSLSGFLPLLLLFVLVLVLPPCLSQVIIRVGGGNCGGLGCDFGPSGLDEAINASQSGDSIFMYGQLFVNPDSPTPGGFPDTIFTVQKSIGFAGLENANIQVISPGTKGLNLFTLAAPNIEMVGFVINRQFVNNNDQNQNVATIRFRNCFNGTCFPVHTIALGGVEMTTDVPFLGTDILFENGTYHTIEIEDGIFTAATGVLINETAQLTGVKIEKNQFLWAAYDNLSPFKARSNVDLRLNFWRPCPYRSAAHILPALGVQEQDDWLPYCVSESCDTPGPIATPKQGGGFRGWTSIEDALGSNNPASPLPVYVTAPFFPVDTSQIIYRRILLTSIVGSCVDACYANGTFPVVRVRNNTAATIGFIVLGDLMSITNLQFELQERTRLALYRQVVPYNQAVFALNRGSLAFESVAFNGNPAMDAALQDALTTNYSMMFSIEEPGGDMELLNLQISGGRQALLFWGPNQVDIVLERDCRLSSVLFGDQMELGVYFAGPTFSLTLESNYFGNNSASFGVLAEKMSGLTVLRSQLIGVGTGIALSQITDSILDCNACVGANQFCISVQTSSSGNEANWNTFAVADSQRFSRNPDNSNTMSVTGSTNLGAVTPIQRVFQQFSAPDFPYQFQGQPMFTSLEDVLAEQDTNSTTLGTQSAAQSLFVKSTYLPYNNVECFGYRDVLSSVYTAYSNVRDGCSVHKVLWDPFDNSTLPCPQLRPVVQAIPEDSWQQTGSVEVSGEDCVGQAQNRSQSLRFAIGTATERNAFLCVGCDGSFTPFSNKTCDFKVDTFQEALEQVRISQLEDATIFVNGVCYVFDEEIDVEGLTIEGCGTAILSPTEGPGVMLPAATEASYQLRITANFTTTQGITFTIVGESNVTYAADYCVVFIDGELLPIFNTTLFNNSFLQPDVDQLCTLMDTWTRVRQNVFRNGRRSVKMSADSNAVVPHVSGVNRYDENDFKDAGIHIFYSFVMPIRRPTQPYSRLQVVDNMFVNPGDVSLDVLGINGRRSRQDLLFLRNHYTNPTPDPAACMEGNTDPDICCEEDKGCDSFAQRFVDSEDALFDNERYFGGAIMQMAGRNVLVQNSKWRDRSGVSVGNTDIALLQNPFSPQNVTMDNVEFNPEATLVCNLGRSFNPATKRDSVLQLRNSIVNGQNIGVTKNTCDQTMIGLLASNCQDRAGNTIFSARNTAPFAADEFIEPLTRVRTNCTPPLVYIPSQQGGTGICNCEFLPDDQFIQMVPFVTVTPTPSGLVMRSHQAPAQTEENSEVKNCPTGQIHNPNNRSECISASATPTPTQSPTPSPTPTPTSTTTKTKHSSSSSSSSNGPHHLWWLWIILGVVILIVIVALIIWIGVTWNRKGKKKKKQEEAEELQEFAPPPPEQTSSAPLVQRNTSTFGDSLRFGGSPQEEWFM